MNAFEKALEVAARRTSLRDAVKEYLQLPAPDVGDESCQTCHCHTCYRRHVGLEIVMKKLLEAVSE
jgi:hypothetical protein